MNKINFKSIALLCFLAIFASCDLNEIDNYEVPNASIFGGIYDIETGELVEQDLLRGMQIEYVEHGFANPQIQYQVVRNNGSFQNKLMFAGTYTMQPLRGNFVVQEKKDIIVKGDTEIKFEVQPYIRIKNATIEKVEGKIRARFNIEQTVANKVVAVALFGHKEINVGDPLHTVVTRQNINDVTNQNTTYLLEIDIDSNGSLVKGNDYYFRIGALIAAPEAKNNYVTAVKIRV